MKPLEVTTLFFVAFGIRIRIIKKHVQIHQLDIENNDFFLNHQLAIRIMDSHVENILLKCAMVKKVTFFWGMGKIPPLIGNPYNGAL